MGVLVRLRGNLFVCGFLVLSACSQTMEGFDTVAASFKDDPELSPEEQWLVDESGEIVERSIFQGAAIGALVGCGIGLLFSNNKPLGCAAGAGIGALGGAVAGAGVGQGNAEAHQVIEKENERIAELNREYDRLIAFEKKLKVRIAEQNTELASLERQLREEQIDAATYREKYLRIRSFREQIATQLEGDLAVRRDDLESVSDSGAVGTRGNRIKKSLTNNIEKIEQLAAASRNLAPPAVPLDAS